MNRRNPVLVLLFVLFGCHFQKPVPHEITVPLEVEMIDDRQPFLNKQDYLGLRFHQGLPDDSLFAALQILEIDFLPGLQDTSLFDSLKLANSSYCVLQFSSSPAPTVILVAGRNQQGKHELWLMNVADRLTYASKKLPIKQVRENVYHCITEVPFTMGEIPKNAALHMTGETVEKDAIVTLSIRIWFYPEKQEVWYRINDFRVGTMTLAGKSYRIGLCRLKGLTHFGHWSGTKVLIDKNHDGQFALNAALDSSGRLLDREAFYTNVPFFINDKAYEVAKVSVDGRRLTLRPSQKTVFPALGFQAPYFAVETVEGKYIRSHDLRGKIVVLDFWFTTCQPCVEEIPGLNKLVEKYRGNKNVKFISIAKNEKTDLEAFLKEHPFNYRQAVTNEEVLKAYGRPFFLTRHMIIDQQGRIAFDDFDASSETYKLLDAAIMKLTAMP